MLKRINPLDLARAMRLQILTKLGIAQDRSGKALRLSFTWKLAGDGTDNAFAVYETQIEPGTGIPVPAHPIAEFIYVLKGNARIVGQDPSAGVAKAAAVNQSAAASVKPPPALRHTATSPVRAFCVARFEHEAAFVALKKRWRQRAQSNCRTRHRRRLRRICRPIP